MQEYSNLGEWILGKWKTQAAFAEKLGVRQGQVSRWIAGANEISEEYQDKIRKAGYKGPWPSEEAKEAPAPAAGPYVTEKDFGKLEGRIEALEKANSTMQEALWYLKLRLKEDLKLDLEREK